MKTTKTALLLSLSSIVVLVASAVTPKPSPTPAATRSPASGSEATRAPSVPDQTPGKSTPASTPEDLPSPMEMLAARPAATPASNAIPNPVLYLLRTEPYTTGGKNWIRYRYDVENKGSYPADMFAPAPTLPPCGTNTNASRTWVDFFDSTGRRLYGFCALTSPADLGKIWFAMEEGVIPPSYVYIELNDRQTNTKYKSNLADTTL